MTLPLLLKHVTTLMTREGLSQGGLDHAPSGMHLLRYTQTTRQDATLYRPLLCLVLQGAKEVGTNTTTVRVGEGASLVVSHLLPVVSRITQATSDHPYVALVFLLDMDLLRTLASETTPVRAGPSSSPFSIAVSPSDGEMEAALLRYLVQSESDNTRQLLAPITRREIHARLLLGPQGEQLQRLLWHETTASRIFQATRAIQSDLSSPIAVGDLAQRAAMSHSAFFEHFKAVTGTSPLQYQKELRLLHARDALRTTKDKVSEVAFRLGYESASQFSRDYARKFGCAPKQDRDLHSWQ
ncbi:AraC family transcriptional regulator N-terminal domain-containing protein [Limnohabitans sp.]|jgi:AraC-like DNA-binding protein|uniref:AraC family transcriptional regulator n=1 Tax=Limnohabitans sp. TaxID=1907725 RepID=UPI0037BF5DC6